MTQRDLPPSPELRPCDQAILAVLADSPRSAQEIAAAIRRSAREAWIEREEIVQTWEDDEPPALVKLLAHGDARKDGLKLLGYEIAPRLRYLERHNLVERIQLEGHRPMLWRLPAGQR